MAQLLWRQLHIQMWCCLQVKYLKIKVIRDRIQGYQRCQLYTLSFATSSKNCQFWCGDEEDEEESWIPQYITSLKHECLFVSTNRMTALSRTTSLFVSVFSKRGNRYSRLQVCGIQNICFEFTSCIVAFEIECLWFIRVSPCYCSSITSVSVQTINSYLWPTHTEINFMVDGS
jgi:hypothetical protein